MQFQFISYITLHFIPHNYKNILQIRYTNINPSITSKELNSDAIKNNQLQIQLKLIARH